MWVKPLKKVVHAEETQLPNWMKLASPSRQDWLLTLECGHKVKRHTTKNKLMPERCQCSKCGHSVM